MKRSSSVSQKQAPVGSSGRQGLGCRTAEGLRGHGTLGSRVQGLGLRVSDVGLSDLYEGFGMSSGYV